MSQSLQRVVVAVTGASGSIYGIRLLERLRQDASIEIHLVISGSGKRTLAEESSLSVQQVESLAHVVYDDRDIGASLASGSFGTRAMVVAPCSIKTLAALAGCRADTLIARAGDVTLKEGRPLLVLVRETPLHLGHLRQMTALAEMGGIVFPPVPAFYPKPRTIDDLVDHTVGRVLERLSLSPAGQEWMRGGRRPGGAAGEA
jgi:4-hydroxy-3-polyprenylbenzoate decarboxylase